MSKIRRPVDALPRKAAIAAALDEMQPDGCGFNPSLCPVANRLKFAAVGYEQALQLAMARADDLGIAPKRRSEIVKAFRKVYNSNSNVKVEFDSKGFHKVVKNVAYVEQICRGGLTAEKLKATTPYSLEGLKTWPVLRQLFPDRNTLLCIGEEEANARVVRRDEELHPDRCQFVVPSPMTAYLGKNQDGDLTPRSKENTGRRRFLVVECDFSYYDRSGQNKTVWYDTIDRLAAIGRTPRDMCASVLNELAMCEEYEGLRLALVVFSGKKSLHGWFYTGDKTDEQLKPFFSRAVSLGADPVTWNPCQWVRMPGGLRYIGEEGDNLRPIRQEIYYFDPNYQIV